MANDMYADAEPSTPVAAPEEPGEEKTEGETAIIPQSLCPGMKQGDEMKVRIERVLENDYEISYPDKGGKEEPVSAPAEGAADSNYE